MEKKSQKLTEIEKDIVAHVQYHISHQHKISMNELSEECHVAKSTIVKTAKKMGYSGYVEMVYHMQNRFHEEAASDLANDLVEGNLDEIVERAVEIIYQYKDCKNLVVAKGNRDLRSNFFSRKLEMFDIFAPSTYEFHMIQNLRMRKGFAIFCDMREDNIEKTEEVIRLVKHEGYYIIAFSDRNNKWIKQYADMEIILRKTIYKTADFYDAKLLIFIELLLSRLANLMIQKKGENHDGTDEIYSE